MLGSIWTPRPSIWCQLDRGLDSATLYCALRLAADGFAVPVKAERNQDLQVNDANETSAICLRARPMSASTHESEGDKAPDVWNIAEMKSGVAAPSPERMTIFAASADTTYPGKVLMMYAFAEKYSTTTERQPCQ